MKFGQVIDIARGFKADMSRMFQLTTMPELRPRKKPTQVRSDECWSIAENEATRKNFQILEKNNEAIDKRKEYSI